MTRFTPIGSLTEMRACPLLHLKPEEALGGEGNGRSDYLNRSVTGDCLQLEPGGGPQGICVLDGVRFASDGCEGECQVQPADDRGGEHWRLHTLTGDGVGCGTAVAGELNNVTKYTGKCRRKSDCQVCRAK